MQIYNPILGQIIGNIHEGHTNNFKMVIEFIQNLFGNYLGLFGKSKKKNCWKISRVIYQTRP
jgi:protein involved in sex pheromone biosynthesis